MSSRQHAADFRTSPPGTMVSGGLMYGFRVWMWLYSTATLKLYVSSIVLIHRLLQSRDAVITSTVSAFDPAQVLYIKRKGMPADSRPQKCVRKHLLIDGIGATYDQRVTCVTMQSGLALVVV